MLSCLCLKSSDEDEDDEAVSTSCTFKSQFDALSMRTVTVDGSATVDDVVLEQILILFDFVVVVSRSLTSTNDGSHCASLFDLNVQTIKTSGREQLE